MGYPKSGNTWVTRLIAELVGCPVAGLWHSSKIEIAREGQHRVSDFQCFKSHHQLHELHTDKDSDEHYIVYVIRDPREAVRDVDVIYTDVWASMGQESEAEKRKKIFKDYQVNESLVAAAKADVKVMHCLPAHRGDEITDGVMDGPHSIVFDEAENRLHIQKAIMVRLMGK